MKFMLHIKLMMFVFLSGSTKAEAQKQQAKTSPKLLKKKKNT